MSQTCQIPPPVELSAPSLVSAYAIRLSISRSLSKTHDWVIMSTTASTTALPVALSVTVRSTDPCTPPNNTTTNSTIIFNSLHPKLSSSSLGGPHKMPTSALYIVCIRAFWKQGSSKRSTECVLLAKVMRHNFLESLMGLLVIFCIHVRILKLFAENCFELPCRKKRDVQKFLVDL